MFEADKVGISTDVSGIVKQIDVGNNQQVERARSCSAWTICRSGSLWSGPTAGRIVRNDLNALKATIATCRRRSKQAGRHRVL